jgi:hypothetical protein
MPFLSKAHFICLYFFFAFFVALLIGTCVLIWMRKRYSLYLIFLLIILVWYLGGLAWRLGFFEYVRHISFFVGSSAENYIAINGNVPTDISQLLGDKNLAKEIVCPYAGNVMPVLKMITHIEDDEVILQIYWIGFDRDDDKYSNNEFPGWFRLLYFPWFYDGDILTYECFYDQSTIELYHSLQKEYKALKYLIMFNDIIIQKDGVIAERITESQNVESAMRNLYQAARKAYSATLGRDQSEVDIDSTLSYIKRWEYFYIPRDRLEYLDSLLKAPQ